VSAHGTNPLLQALWPFGLLYGTCMAVRNWTFDARLREVVGLGVPVTSVGNLTVGGTGKTPTVLWLAQRAHELGHRVGVLARGYGRQPGARLNDEGMLLERRLPWLLQEQDPDRVAAGRKLVAQGATLILVDDGFQHRRVARDADLVCMDARRPFADGALLPAGMLREFRSGLARATAILLTRAGSLSAADLEDRVTVLRRYAHQPKLPVFATHHQPIDVLREPDGTVLPLEALRGRRVVALCAIARPDAFEATLRELGAEPVRTLAYRDHHTFTARELQAALDHAHRQDALLVTTEKDAVRMGDFAGERHVLRIGLRFLGAEPTAEQLRWR